MFSPEDYTTIANLLPRLFGLIYFFAIGPFLFQILGLIGSNGILPVAKFLESVKESYPSKCYAYVPTLFWINSSNKALVGVVIIGLLASIVLMLGFYPSLMLILLYLLYLSIVSVGQDFLSFGWEGFLLEATIYVFLISLPPVPTLLSWICINFLLFRFYFKAGAVKLQSRDPNWKNLTALAFHYESQPLPNTIAWYVHKFPMWFHKASTLLMFVAELIVPFGIFGPEVMRTWVFFIFLGLQWTIWVTGNFSYLNHLSVVLSTILLNNQTLSAFINPPHADMQVNPIYAWTVSALAGVFLCLQLIRFWHHFFPNRLFRKWMAMCYPYHIANPYGIFAVMTTERIEIIIEGSEDGFDWKEYAFRYKPSEVDRRPGRISPYQPRIDWQAWFLPFSYFSSEPWFQLFLFHLLKGTPDVVKLLRVNPFKDTPPKYVRAMMYDYRFSTYQEKKETGQWWIRRFVGPYSPVMKLK